MANFNPAKVGESLKGLDFPATKKEIVDCARGNNADQEVLNVLDRLTDREYGTQTDIMETLGSEDSESE